MKTLILTTTTMAALLFAGTDAAEAGKFQLVIGNGGGYVNPGYGVNPGFGPGYGGYAPINNGHLHHDDDHGFHQGPTGGHYDWHDTTHYDYIPGRWVKHGCHWDYIPGRYVLHQDGHWDLHHH